MKHVPRGMEVFPLVTTDYVIYCFVRCHFGSGGECINAYLPSHAGIFWHMSQLRHTHLFQRYMIISQSNAFKWCEFIINTIEMLFVCVLRVAATYVKNGRIHVETNPSYVLGTNTANTYWYQSNNIFGFRPYRYILAIYNFKSLSVTYNMIWALHQ